MIFLENVPRFDVGVFQRLLPQDYKLELINTSPIIAGVPSGGDRLFIKALPHTTVNLGKPIWSFSTETLEELLEDDCFDCICVPHRRQG